MNVVTLLLLIVRVSPVAVSGNCLTIADSAAVLHALESHTDVDERQCHVTTVGLRCSIS